MKIWGNPRCLPLISFSHLVHRQITQVDDEPLERQPRINRLDHQCDSSRIALVHLLADERSDLGNILADLRVSRLIDWHAVSATSGERRGWVDLTDAEDCVDDDFD